MNLLSYFIDQLRHMAAQGGWVFWALILLAFGIAFALVSIVHLLRLPNAPRLSSDEWLGLLRHGGGVGKGDESATYHLLPIAAELPLIEQQLFTRIERRFRFAFVLITAAPLVGLLGTVSGMMAAFDGLASSSVQTPLEVISGGVSEALITTQVGLVIAVPAFIVAKVLNSRLKHLQFGFQKLGAAVRRASISTLSTG